ncbi:MAG TPA: hypothetical protein VK669_07495 [Candidatus Limnocylindrales bacterium]|nr:hypothetical protein [Candidatus Limnocylindrales bacterium]
MVNDTMKHCISRAGVLAFAITAFCAAAAPASANGVHSSDDVRIVAQVATNQKTPDPNATGAPMKSEDKASPNGYSLEIARTWAAAWVLTVVVAAIVAFRFAPPKKPKT